MSPEAATEAIVPKHAPLKKDPKTDPDVLASVLGDIAHERRTAYLQLRKRNTRVNKEFQRLSEAATDAKSAVQGHARYKKHYPSTQAWDEENRLLNATQKSADTALDAYRQKLQASQELAQMQTLVAELDREWKYHARYGDKVDLDMKQFWTPERGFTDAEVDEIEKAAAAEDKPTDATPTPPPAEAAPAGPEAPKDNATSG